MRIGVRLVVGTLRHLQQSSGVHLDVLLIL